MYNVSENFTNYLRKNIHTIKGTISIATDEGTIVIPFGESNIQSDSFSISEQCISGSTYEIGAVCSKELSMTISLPDIREYALMGAEISVEFGVETDTENVFEWIPMGKYFITMSKKYRDYTIISACDAIGLIDLNDNVEKPVTSQLGTSMQPYDILEKICSYAGFEIGNTKEEIEAMPNGTLYSYVPEDTEISSTRDILSYLAVFLGGFATTDRSGKIVIKQHMHEPIFTIKNNLMKSNSTAISDFEMILCGAIVWLDEGNSWAKVWYPDYEKKPNSTIIDTTDNPFMVGYYLFYPEPIGEAETRLENMYVPLGAISEQCFFVNWIPFECEYFGNPALDAGDCIKIENYDGTETTSVISHNTFRFRNTQKLRCAGEDTRLMVGVRTESKRLYEITEKKINNVKGINITQAEFDTIFSAGKLIENRIYNIIG